MGGTTRAERGGSSRPRDGAGRQRPGRREGGESPLECNETNQNRWALSFFFSTFSSVAASEDKIEATTMAVSLHESARVVRGESRGWVGVSIGRGAGRAHRRAGAIAPRPSSLASSRRPSPIRAPLVDLEDGRIRGARRDSACFCAGDGNAEAMKKAPDFVPAGEWTVLPNRGVTAPKGFKASGISAGLRASSKRPDLALVFCPDGATAAGVFTQNLMCAAPVTFCKKVLEEGENANVTAVLINAGQANAATGSQGWQDALDSADALSEALDGVTPSSTLLQSTGVIGQRIKMEPMIAHIPDLVGALGEDDSAALRVSDPPHTTFPSEILPSPRVTAHEGNPPR